MTTHKDKTLMTREEELRLMDEFIKKNGVTMLPKDERGADYVMPSPWDQKKKKSVKKKREQKTKDIKK